nr:hypothetical transcript [Hymenolepis microstoma]
MCLPLSPEIELELLAQKRRKDCSARSSRLDKQKLWTHGVYAWLIHSFASFSFLYHLPLPDLPSSEITAQNLGCGN